MKTGILKVIIRSAFSLVCLVSLSVQAQMPGAGGPAGMSAALTKLFGDVTAFSANATISVVDGSQQEIINTPMDFALLDKKIRVAMDMTQAKNKNMPANAAGVDLDAETVIALSAHPNIIGLKDSSGNVAKMAQIVAEAREGFAVLAGSAGFLLPALAVGARGAIAALANIAPRECLRLMALWQEGKLEEARALQARLIPVNNAVTSGYGVAGLKAALEFVAHYGGAPRRPLPPLNEGERVRLRGLLAEADLLHAMRPVV